MFEDDYKAANDALSPSEEAEQRTLYAMRRSMDGADNKPRRLSIGLRTAVAACLCLLFVAPAIIGVSALASKLADKGHAAIPTEYGSSASSAVVPDDYSEVFEWLRPSLMSAEDVKSNGRFIWYNAEVMPASDQASYGQLDSVNGDSEQIRDHSGTNVQVEGVDESDIVKTDGRYIFVLNNEGVAVLSAEGANTHTVAHIPEKEMPRHNEEANRSFRGMYLADGKLIVIAQEYKHSPFYYGCGILDDVIEPEFESSGDQDDTEPDNTEDCYYCMSWFSGDTVAYVFDIANADEPKRISTLCMEGSFRDSRLTDGRLYLITSYYPDTEVYANDPATFIPSCFNSDGERILTPAQDINRIGDGRSYTYIAAVNVAEPDEFAETLALLGPTDTVYCSGSSIFLTMLKYSEERESIRFFIDENTGECTVDDNGDNEGELVTWYEKTEICRVSLAGGRPVLAAQGSVDGGCLNQFSLDEYNGHLRIAVTKDVSRFIEQQLEDGGETGYSYGAEDKRDNAVYVLDSELHIVGRLEGLASGEQIKSVRFMGDIGYVVTFRQTDPLFSIDLSEPDSPKVVGKLKIPGFSEYLHYWGDGLLFGFGQMADTESGGTEGIKLSMFDVSDPSNVTERACLHIADIDHSNAEYDHKAILVAPERGLIGFPDEFNNRYVIYSYDGSAGFVRKASVSLNASDWYGCVGAGLYVGSDFYVIDVSGMAYVIDLDTFELSETVKF